MRLISFLLVAVTFSGWFYSIHVDHCSPLNWEECR